MIGDGFFVIRPIKIFCACAHKDQELRDELQKHIILLQYLGHIDFWHNGLIGPGAIWETTIADHLKTADIILLLLSADFIYFHYYQEMMHAFERQKRGEVRVIPILVRHLCYQGTPLSAFQMLPTNGIPVKSWTDRDEAWANVVAGISQVVDEIRDERIHEVSWQSPNGDRHKRIVFTKKFARSRKQLSGSLQHLVEAKIGLLQWDHAHPSLRVRRVLQARDQNMWICYASSSLRLLYSIKDDSIYLEDVISHRIIA